MAGEFEESSSFTEKAKPDHLKIQAPERFVDAPLLYCYGKGPAPGPLGCRTWHEPKTPGAGKVGNVMLNKAKRGLEKSSSQILGRTSLRVESKQCLLWGKAAQPKGSFHAFFYFLDGVKVVWMCRRCDKEGGQVWWPEACWGQVTPLRQGCIPSSRSPLRHSPELESIWVTNIPGQTWHETGSASATGSGVSPRVAEWSFWSGGGGGGGRMRKERYSC